MILSPSFQNFSSFSFSLSYILKHPLSAIEPPFLTAAKLFRWTRMWCRWRIDPDDHSLEMFSIFQCRPTSSLASKTSFGTCSQRSTKPYPSCWLTRPRKKVCHYLHHDFQGIFWRNQAISWGETPEMLMYTSQASIWYI